MPSLATVSLGLLVLLPTAGAADVHYRLTQAPAAAGAPWLVDVEVTGASPDDGPLRFALDDFGGWQDLASPYLALLSADPAPHVVDLAAGVFETDVPRAGDGSVRLAYRVTTLPMHSDLQRANGLLPASGPAYAFGWSTNVLVQVSDDHGPVQGRRTLELRAPPGVPIVTGWSGRSEGAQRVELAVEPGNGPIAFGTPRFAARSGAGDARDGGEGRAGAGDRGSSDARNFAVEVFQFGEGGELADVVADVLVRAAPALGRLFGQPARQPYRAFVSDHSGGGMGSHHGLWIAHTADESPERRDSPWLAAFVLHEHIHDWLGISVGDEHESLTWFMEGFTEYLSLWAAAATGLVPRVYFATRLLELEQIARTDSALGEVRFGDPSVRWRDGDGRVERLAYTGAPLLALLIDLDLRGLADADMPGEAGAGGRVASPVVDRRGASRADPGGPRSADNRGGLPALVRALLADGPRRIDLAELRRTFEALGLGSRWAASIDGTELPDTRTLLERAGFALVGEPTDLSYVGLRADGDGPGATVTAVDPDGPGAAAGVRVGDVITGWFRARDVAASVVAPVADNVSAPAAAPLAASVAGDPGEYPFGLTLFEPGALGAFLGVRRGDTDWKLDIVPRVLPGAGRVTHWSDTGARLDWFFSLDG